MDPRDLEAKLFRIEEALGTIESKINTFNRTNFHMFNCCFCGLAAGRVTWLIQGQHASICDECVSLCNQIIDDNKAKFPKKPIA